MYFGLPLVHKEFVMATQPKNSLKALASVQTLQLLVALLFLSMGIVGFTTGGGATGRLSSEISGMFGGDSELLAIVLSTVELLCGLFLGANLFVGAIPQKFSKIAMGAVLVIWIALIVILDILTIDFGRFDGSEWFVWIEQVVLHLIVLASIVRIQK
jgi:hypothetical protein